MYYEQVFKVFQARSVAYLIAGGMAVNLHGVPRFTKDLDILVDTSQNNLKRLGAALKQLGYRPRVPVTMEEFLNPANWPKWKKEKGMIAFTLHRPAVPYEEIDILVNSPVPYSIASKDGVKLKVGALSVHLVSIDDLIRMKRKAGRAQDLSDIAALKKVKKERHVKKSKKGF